MPPIGRSRGGYQDVRPPSPIFFILMQFSANILPHKCQGLTKSVKFQRKDQSVKRNAYFYYFGQFHVFPLYF